MSEAIIQLIIENGVCLSMATLFLLYLAFGQKQRTINQEIKYKHEKETLTTPKDNNLPNPNRDSGGRKQ